MLPAKAPSMLPLRAAAADCSCVYTQDNFNFQKIYQLSVTSQVVVSVAVTLANKCVLPLATSASPLSVLAQCGQR